MKTPKCPICGNPPCHSFSTDHAGIESEFSFSCSGVITVYKNGCVDRSGQHSTLITQRQPTREAAKQKWVQIVRDIKRKAAIAAEQEVKL